MLTRTDMVIVPVGALEQHGFHLPIGTDVFNGIEQAKLIEPTCWSLPFSCPGSPHTTWGFAGAVSLRADPVQAVYVEAAQSLIRHGFTRFLILHAHGRNKRDFDVYRGSHQSAALEAVVYPLP